MKPSGQSCGRFHEQICQLRAASHRIYGPIRDRSAELSRFNRGADLLRRLYSSFEKALLELMLKTHSSRCQSERTRKFRNDARVATFTIN